MARGIWPDPRVNSTGIYHSGRKYKERSCINMNLHSGGRRGPRVGVSNSILVKAMTETIHTDPPKITKCSQQSHTFRGADNSHSYFPLLLPYMVSEIAFPAQLSRV